MGISTLILLLLGVVLVVVGSDILVDGSSDIARRSGLSEFVIGLTIVGIGTSTPEMVVSFLSAFRGSADMSVGNILGSNIFNTCMILGVTAVILPMVITRANIRRDIPLNIMVTILLILLGLNKSIFGTGRNELSRIDGMLMLGCFAYYIYTCFKNGAEDAKEDMSQKDDSASKAVSRPLYLSILMILGGLAALVLGGHLFVDNATVIARNMGWSDKFIGITILAMGTSLPELATCVVAAFKKKGQLALGNIIGSNISNILLVLGGSALINPLVLNNITPLDLGFLLLAALFPLAAYFSFDKKMLDRAEGVVLLLMEAGYFYMLVTAL